MSIINAIYNYLSPVKEVAAHVTSRTPRWTGSISYYIKFIDYDVHPDKPVTPLCEHLTEKELLSKEWIYVAGTCYPDGSVACYINGRLRHTEKHVQGLGSRLRQELEDITLPKAGPLASLYDIKTERVMHPEEHYAAIQRSRFVLV